MWKAMHSLSLSTDCAINLVRRRIFKQFMGLDIVGGREKRNSGLLDLFQDSLRKGDVEGMGNALFTVVDNEKMISREEKK